ncbi:MAG: DUF3352 domain-containing protein [Pirellulales bacterium]|nr:DUF3352 domain-containing protein [Pirellulales bacterium]
MLLHPKYIARLVTCTWLLACSLPSFAAPASDTLLPATTKGYLSIANTEQLKTNWQQTMLGQLAEDEVMKPFINDLREQIQKKVANIQNKVGLSLGDLEGVATGEVSLSLVQPSSENASVVLTADVTGKADEAKQLMDRVDKNLTQQKAIRTSSNAHGVQMTVYTLPADETHRVQKVVVYLHDNLFCTTDNLNIATDMLRRTSGDASDSLRHFEPYRATMDRCARSLQTISPDVRWFMEPIGYTRAYRSIASNIKKRRGRDLLEIFNRQGFDAIRGIGGYVSFYANSRYEILHRTAVYAPADPKAEKGEKYRLAMRMLEFPAGGDLAPLSWIPRGVATYTSFKWNIQNAFDHAESIVDEFIGEGGFQAAIDGIKKGEYGPHVDLRQELIAHLGNRVMVFTDYDVPITTRSEHFLFAVEATNIREVDKAIRKLMESDPNARERAFEGNVIWELVEEADVPQAPDIDDLIDSDPILGSGEEEEEKKGPAFPNSCICVANGCLLFASNFDFLTNVLVVAEERETLAHTADFNQMQAIMQQITQADVCLRSFSRTDEEYRPTYELLREGKMPESETLLGRILNQMLTDDDVELREQKFDGSKLPSFEYVRRYFGPAGFAVLPEEDGWFLVGVMIRKDAE